MKNELEIFLEQFDKLTLDSRQISKNTVFIAYPGKKFDGRDFIEQAVNNGVNGIVFESENYKKKLNLRIVGQHETTHDKQYISWVSPLGKSLLGREREEVVSVDINGVHTTYTIIKIDY